jgi:predicted flavoprotein YhiN
LTRPGASPLPIVSNGSPVSGEGPPAACAVVVGGGPAGLMAGERLLQAGCRVRLFDAMPSVGRKFLLAGKGGLNLTHGEPRDAFVARYRERAPEVSAWLDDFGPQQLRDWAAGLGIETFVGSSGRVFPRDMKAAPLLRDRKSTRLNSSHNPASRMPSSA